jgi:hypothetical protein
LRCCNPFWSWFLYAGWSRCGPRVQCDATSEERGNPALLGAPLWTEGSLRSSSCLAPLWLLFLHSVSPCPISDFQGNMGPVPGSFRTRV